MVTDIADLPKVELHLHLDCCLSYRAVHALDPRVTPEAFRREFVAPARCLDLADYLRVPPRSVALLQSAGALALAVDDLFEQLAADRVVYAELRFAPLLHAARGLPAARAVEAVERAVSAAVGRTGIEASIILCTLRHFSADQSGHTARLAVDFRGTRVAALDLAGDEAGYPLDPHLAAFRLAREQGVPFTVHAGEARGPAGVWQVLNTLDPPRLGHGVRSTEDDRLVTYLAARRVHLEVCPSCNVQTGVCAALAEHPVDRLYRRGVSLGISTDTRTITDVTLTEEYRRLAAVFGWTADDFRACNLAANGASFAPEDVKRAVRDKLAAGT